MSDATVAITAGTGTSIDVSSVTTGSGTVNRQRVVIGDDVGADGLASVTSNHLQVTTADVSSTATISAATTTATTGGNTTLTTPPVVINMAGRRSAGIVLSGATAWTVGTVSVYGSLDGTNYVPLDLFDEVGEKWISSIPANTVGSWWVESLGAFKTLAVVAGAGWTGSVSCTLMASTAEMHTPEWVSGLNTVLPNNVGLVGGSDGTNLRPLSVTNTGVVNTTQVPVTSGGLTISRLLSAATTNSTSVKASAGQVYGWSLQNTSTSPKFVKLYNKASGPTVGTDTPVMTLMVPTTSGNNFMGDVGIPFATGIAFAITGAVADADTTSVAANDVILNLFYK